MLPHDVGKHSTRFDAILAMWARHHQNVIYMSRPLSAEPHPVCRCRRLGEESIILRFVQFKLKLLINKKSHNRDSFYEGIEMLF